MTMQITITDAGRAALVNAQNTGTGAVVISQVGFGTGQYTPQKTRTALQAQIKRVSTISGAAVAADTIHVTATDESADAYNVGEFGLFTNTGVLFAVYSQPAASGWIMQKAPGSTLLLAIDVVLATLDAANITFGDASFLNPPATVDTPGVVRLATSDEAIAGTNTAKALTPAGLAARTASITRSGIVRLEDTGGSTDKDRAATADLARRIYLTALQRLEKSQNLADLPGPAMARANLGLGSMATRDTGEDNTQHRTNAQNDARYPQRSNNLSDLTAPATARTNLGLGSMATRATGTANDQHRTNTQNDARFTQRSNNLSDLANAATARDNLDVAQKQQSPTDETVGRSLILGAFGLGNMNAIMVDNWNDVRRGGFYQSTGITTGAPRAEAAVYQGVYIPSANASAGLMILGRPGSGEVFVRSRASGTWGAWQQMLRDGDGVVRTTGAQDVDGIKIFTSPLTTKGPTARIRTLDSAAFRFENEAGTVIRADIRRDNLQSGGGGALQIENRDDAGVVKARLSLLQSGAIHAGVGQFSGPGAGITSLSTSTVLAAMAGAEPGAVGTTALLYYPWSGSVEVGDFVAGSNLRASGLGRASDAVAVIRNDGPFQTGTWRSLGAAYQSHNGALALFLRVS